jgi:predicted RNA-binding protein
MCLAKAYVRSQTDPKDLDARDKGVDEGLLIMENVTQVQVDGDRIHLRSLLGDAETVQGRVINIDFAEGRLVLQGAV